MKNMMLDAQVTPNGLKDRMMLLSALEKEDVTFCMWREAG
ncbi:hypothetical protein GMA19_01783 [Paenibacillus polymyxa E681]|nr:hypothetical protein PPE_05620 [Paenibacillus polymyxa E681]QNV56619.1 hypothetical protein GE561_01783 [Paenibacillus polymyxa E681]QNV61456.1 hypothetical protein GMA19_01783 [Paenibacillus polymyxa E681]